MLSKTDSLCHTQNPTWDCWTPLGIEQLPYSCPQQFSSHAEKQKQANRVGSSNPWYEMSICLHLFIHELTSVYLAMHILCPKQRQSWMSKTHLVQPQTAVGFRPVCYSTGLRYCRVRQKQFRAQKKATWFRSYSSGILPEYLLEWMVSWRTSTKNSSLWNWNLSNPNGFNWLREEDCFMQ